MATTRWRTLGPIVILGFAAAVLGATIFLWPVATARVELPVGGAFSLIDQTGLPMTDKDLLNKPTLFFFGYTHCPDICPTTLFELSETLDRLGPKAGGVNALFITVDPERDTPR